MSVVPSFPLKYVLRDYDLDIKNSQFESRTPDSRSNKVDSNGSPSPPPPYTQITRSASSQCSETDAAGKTSTFASRIQRTSTDDMLNGPALFEEFAKAYDSVLNQSSSFASKLAGSDERDPVDQSQRSVWTEIQKANMEGDPMNGELGNKSYNRKEERRRPVLIRENTCIPSYNDMPNRSTENTYDQRRRMHQTYKAPEQFYQEQQQESLYNARQNQFATSHYYIEPTNQDAPESRRRAQSMEDSRYNNYVDINSTQSPRRQRPYIQPPAPTPLQPQRLRASSAPSVESQSAVTCMSYMNSASLCPAYNPSKPYRPPPNPLYNIYRCNGVQVNYYDSTTRGPYEPLPTSARPIKGILKNKEARYNTQVIAEDTSYEDERPNGDPHEYELAYTDPAPVQQCGNGCGCVVTEDELQRIIQIERRKERQRIEEMLRRARMEKEQERRREERRARRQRELEEKNWAWIIESGWNVY